MSIPALVTLTATPAASVTVLPLTVGTPIGESTRIPSPLARSTVAFVTLVTACTALIALTAWRTTT